jgi:rhodanese-related sulfurtransferase
VDLRETAEFREGHIVGALHVPFSKWKERIGELDAYKQRPLVVVDKMGQHSAAVGKHLMEQGYHVARLNGGMSEWQGSNLPVIRE